MDSLLDALQEGRLFELPEEDKAHALQFLAHVIEAFPEVPAGTDVAGDVMKREQAANTALGRGWACPHAHVPFDEDLMCVIGWSPKGVDYGAPDNKPVALIVMYLVPLNQRHHYLREISTIARAVEGFPGLDKLGEAKDLDDIRNYLLDLIDSTRETSGSEARARMIRLQAKPSPAALAVRDLSNLVIEPVTLVTAPGCNPIALTQNPRLLKWIDGASDLLGKIESEGLYESSGWRLIRRGTVSYRGGRVAYECVAIRVLTDGNGNRRGDRSTDAGS
jgi:nitrogen PTS system EIIA component